MDKPVFRKIFEPELKDPIFVEGLAGLGNVGMIAAFHLIECINAKVFAELYAPYFPDYVAVKKNGTCRPPRYRFYAANTEKNSYIILTGESQPSLEDTVAHYDLCDVILDFVQKYGTSFVVTMGGVSATETGNEVFIAATSEELAQKHTNKDVKVYTDSKIVGASGLLLGLAQRRGLQGICLLGVTAGFGTERGIALSVYKALMNIFEPDRKDTALPEKKPEPEK
ncbi:MAG: PAC2 family protein [Candidatus Bathyarchaeia archaeon]